MVIRSNIVLIVVSSLLGIYWLARWYEHTSHEEHAIVQPSFADKTINQKGNFETQKSVTPIVKITSTPSKEIVEPASPKPIKAIPDQDSSALPSPTVTQSATTKRKSKTVVLTLSSNPDAKKENSEEESHEEKVATENTVVGTEASTEKKVATDNVKSVTGENTPAIVQVSKQQDKNADAIVEKSIVGFIASALQSPTPRALPSVETDTTESQLTAAAINKKSGKPIVAASQRLLTAQQLLKKTNESKPNSEIHNSEIENPKNTASYRINKGDTLYALARRFNTTIDTLKEINGLHDNTIHVGERIRYPDSN